MTVSLWLFLVALLASPAVAYLIYRLARELGFLEPPLDRQHELRRTILAALYALLLILPVFLFGYAQRWPRLWVVFGVFSGLALAFFGLSAALAAWKLWKLRHPPQIDAVVEAAADPK
jgi:hypothetical protein